MIVYKLAYIYGIMVGIDEVTGLGNLVGLYDVSKNGKI